MPIKDTDKPARYDIAEASIRKSLQADEYASLHKLPCSGKFCQDSVYAATLDELADIRTGKAKCEHCRKFGVSKNLLAYKTLCPSAFLAGETATVIDKLPCKDAYNALKEWGERFPARSVWLYGNTGTGKSRMLFIVLYHCVLARGYDFIVIRGGELRQIMLEAYANGNATVNKEKQRMIDTALLVFDDFGQDELTMTMLSDVWQVLDKRFGDGKPTAFLSNFAPADLRSRYGGFFALDSMIRRIEEFSDFIYAK